MRESHAYSEKEERQVTGTALNRLRSLYVGKAGDDLQEELSSRIRDRSYHRGISSPRT